MTPKKQRVSFIAEIRLCSDKELQGKKELQKWGKKELRKELFNIFGEDSQSLAGMEEEEINRIIASFTEKLSSMDDKEAGKIEELVKSSCYSLDQYRDNLQMIEDEETGRTLVKIHNEGAKNEQSNRESA